MTLAKNYISEIRQILQSARQRSYQAVNAEMVMAYWQIGKRIVEEEQQGEERAAYGEGLIKELSKALTGEFGKGFSIANLENFRKFYSTFSENEKPYALRRELSWTHYRLIMRVENPVAIQFYVKECAEQNWSTRQLERNIKTHFHQRTLSSKSPPTCDLAPSGKLLENIVGFIRDPYVFEFLNIPQPDFLSETELEDLLIEHLKNFLLELGKGFSFVGRQFRISTESKHFYIDLVFYNYLLKCFVVIDLKTGKLTHQDIGQLDMYVRMFDDLKRGKDDHPTVGIILCAEKDTTIVKYSVLNENQQMFASKYLTYLPTEEELKAHIEEDRLFIAEKLSDKKRTTE